MDSKSERLRDACELAAQAFRNLQHPDFNEIASKLEFCIGSYNFDKNPSGLVEFGHQALEMLREINKEHPGTVAIETLTALDDSLI